jgi:hypothetical protein
MNKRRIVARELTRLARELVADDPMPVQAEAVKEVHDALGKNMNRVDAWLSGWELSKKQRQDLTDVANHIEKAMEALRKVKA